MSEINVNKKVKIIARMCHEANRVMRISLDENPGPPWEDAPEEMKNSSYVGVLHALEGATPESMHESWLAERKNQGWTYGFPLDREKKIHPNLIPYDDLSIGQKLKDDLFLTIVQTYAR